MKGQTFALFFFYKKPSQYAARFISNNAETSKYKNVTDLETANLCPYDYFRYGTGNMIGDWDGQDQNFHESNASSPLFVAAR
jgi:hypothetical protein